MIMPFGHLQIGTQYSHVQRRGRLANTAAELVNNLAARVGMRLLITACGCALANRAIIGKLVARIEDGAVDGFSRQTDVVRTRCVALVEIGRRARERIVEQLRLERLCRDGRLGDRHRNGVGLLRAVADDLPGLVSVERYACLAGNDGLAVLLADGGIDRVTDNVGCDLVNVNRRSGCHISRDLIRLKVHQADLIGQRLLYRIRVKLDARLAGMHDQIAVLQLPGRIDRLGQRRVRDFVERAAQTFLVYGCRNLRLSVTAHCTDDIAHALERIAGAAYFICVLGGLDAVHAFQHLIDRNIIVGAVNRHRDIFALVQRRTLVLNGVCRIIAVHAADCNRSDGHTRKNIRVAVHIAECTGCRRNDNPDGNLYTDRNTTFLLRLLRFRPDGLRRFFRLFGLLFDQMRSLLRFVCAFICHEYTS